MGIRPSNWRQRLADCADKQCEACSEAEFVANVVEPLKVRDVRTVNAAIQRIFDLRRQLEGLMTASPAVFQLHFAMSREQEACCDRIRDLNAEYIALYEMLTGERPGIRTILKAIAPYGQNRVIAEEILAALDDPSLPDVVIDAD